MDEAHRSLAQLRKALAEKEDRKRQLSKELDEKDRQLSETLSKVEGEAAQRETGCQPVTPKFQNQDQSQTLSSAEGQTLEGDTLSEAERIAKKRRESAARSFEREIEYVRNTSGPGAFASWLRRKGIDPAKFRRDDPATHRPAPHGLPPRSPPSIDFASQGRPKEVR